MMALPRVAMLRKGRSRNFLRLAMPVPRRHQGVLSKCELKTLSSIGNTQKLQLQQRLVEKKHRQTRQPEARLLRKVRLSPPWSPRQVQTARMMMGTTSSPSCCGVVHVAEAALGLEGRYPWTGQRVNTWSKVQSSVE